MKIVYDGVDYRQITATRGAAPLHLIEMQAQSKSNALRGLLPEGGLSLSLLQRWSRDAQAYAVAVARWERAAKAGDTVEEPAPPDCALWLTVVNLFLSLRAGGWQGTLLDAAAIPQGDVRYVREVGDATALADDTLDGVDDAPDPTSRVSLDGPATPGDDASPVG